jgi:hypothetical protein
MFYLFELIRTLEGDIPMAKAAAKRKKPAAKKAVAKKATTARKPAAKAAKAVKKTAKRKAA